MHGQWYECAGHPVHFYQYVLIAVLVLLGLYFLLNLYNLLWLLLPSMTRLGRILAFYRESKGGEGNLEQIYYDTRNTRLLLDLLCSSSGPALPLRSLALFDPALQLALLPSLQDQVVVSYPPNLLSSYPSTLLPS